MDPRLSIHDLRIVPGDSHTNVLFDLVFPAGYTGDKDARLAEMCNSSRSRTRDTAVW